MNFLRRKNPQSTFNSLKSHERTLFHLIQKQDFNLFRQIMDSENVDPNIRDQQGNTLLIYSVDDDAKILFTKYLLLKGADLNAVDVKGMDALFKASYWGEKETVEMLVKKKKADLNRENKAFNFVLTPLAAAIFKNHYEVAKILLYNGADPCKAEKIVFLEYKVFSEAYTEKYQNLVDFYKRWHKGKKQILIAYHLAKQRKSYQKSSVNIHPFDIGLLPKSIVIRIARDFL